MSVTIAAVDGLEVLDSRGNPTVSARVTLSSGATGSAAVPSGASTGRFEALELRDEDSSRYGGKGVRKAVAHVRGELAALALGRDPFDQQGLDRAMVASDGTANKGRLGANALLAVSLATALAAAAHSNDPPWRHFHALQAQAELQAHPGPGAGGRIKTEPVLPLPMINLLSGGKHAGAQVDFQDFLIVPLGAQHMAQALEMTHRVYYAALELLQREHAYQPLVADEGGWAPRLDSNEAMLELTLRSIEAAGLRPGEDVAIALDVAASHFYADGRYHLTAEGCELGAEEMIERLADWCARYPVLSLEDALAEDDWEHWPRLQTRLGGHCQILGDDFFVTNPQRIRRGIGAQAANAVLIKVNQIGTLSEALEAVSLARSAGWRTVVSARSGETEDAWLADLATGTGAGQIKIGSITRSERLAKYNRLLEMAHRWPELPFAHGVLDGLRAQRNATHVGG